jgi:DNA-binding winged helix-turn-helix (wHTH) protein
MRVAFDEFVLDTGTRELSREGRRLDLTPKAFELLAILIANRPRVVTKGDLQEQLWPDTFVVDKNLANLISEIRDALGDDPSHPRFVRTAHRIGYAFRHGGGTNDPRNRPGHDAARIFRLVLDDQHFTLQEGEHVLGRDPDADVYLTSPSVSRRHAVIRITARDATIEDLGSRNGTFVGERRIDTASRLENGTAIRIGTVVLTFHAVQAPASTKSVGSK